MDINRDNYEAWLLDRIEGRLSPEEEEALQRFLSEHPDCEHPMMEYPGFRVQRPDISYEHKASLKKEFLFPGDQVSRSNFDMVCIAAMEGDLDAEQLKEFKLLLKSDDDLLKQWKLWQKSCLSPEEISYPRKKKLQKRGSILQPVFWISGAAAAIILLLLLVEEIAPVMVHQEKESVAAVAEEKPTVESASVPALVPDSVPAAVPSVVPAPEPVSEKLIPLRIAETVLPVLEEELELQAPLQISAPKLTKNRLAALDHFPSAGGQYDHIDEMQLASLAGEPAVYGVEDWRNHGLKDGYRQFLEENDINLVSVASAGINGINSITGSDMNFDVDRDEQGKVRRFHFKSAFLSVNAPMKKQH